VGRLGRNRDFTLFWAGQTIGDLGTAVSTVVLPLIAVSTLDASPIAVGALSAATWLPWLLIGLPAGAWVDRLPYRPVLVGCDLGRMLLIGSVPVAAAAGHLGLPQLYVVAFGTGVGTVFFQVAYQAYLPTLVDRDDLTAGNARLQASSSVALVGGPGLGGLLSQVMRAPYALAVDAVSYLVSAATLLAIRTREAPRPETAREPLHREVRTGARYVLADPLLRVLTIAPAAGNPFFAGVMALTVLFLVRTVGVRPGVVGVLLAAGSLGGIAGALLARRIGRALGTARTVWLSMTLTAPAALLIPLTANGARLVCFVIGTFVLEAGILVYNVTVVAWRQAYVPAALIGRVVATMRFLLFGTIPLGGLLGGALAGWIGVREAMWVLVAGNLLMPLLLIASPLRRLRDLPTAPVALLSSRSSDRRSGEGTDRP
jgi:predicted MFS family arabinose efflux permease